MRCSGRSRPPWLPQAQDLGAGASLREAARRAGGTGQRSTTAPRSRPPGHSPTTSSSCGKGRGRFERLCAAALVDAERPDRSPHRRAGAARASPRPRSPARSCTSARSGAPGRAARPASPCRSGRGHPRLGRRQDRRRPLGDDVLRSPHRRGRVHGQHLVDDEPVAERSDGGQVLLHRRRQPGMRPDVGRHVERRDPPAGRGARPYAARVRSFAIAVAKNSRNRSTATGTASTITSGSATVALGRRAISRPCDVGMIIGLSIRFRSTAAFAAACAAHRWPSPWGLVGV